MASEPHGITNLMKEFFRLVDNNFNIDGFSYGTDDTDQEFLNIIISDEDHNFYEIKINPCEPI